MPWLTWWLWPLGAPRPAWVNVYPNLVASALTAVVLYLWKLRPHLRRAEAHRRHVLRSLAALHRKVSSVTQLAIFDGTNHPTAATVIADGLAGGLLYCGTPTSPKDVTRAQYADYAAHHLLVILAFEHVADDVAGGAAAGARNARALAADAVVKGIPLSVPALATIDEHVSAANLDLAMAYQTAFRNALRQLGWTGPVGVYGFSEVLRAAHAAGNADFYFGAGSRSSMPAYTNVWQDNTQTITVGGAADDKDWILIPITQETDVPLSAQDVQAVVDGLLDETITFTSRTDGKPHAVKVRDALGMSADLFVQQTKGFGGVGVAGEVYTDTLLATLQAAQAAQEGVATLAEPVTGTFEVTGTLNVGEPPTPAPTTPEA